VKSVIEGYIGKREDGTKSRTPAKLDRWQSITGLILGLFIVGHMFFTSSILLGKDAMYFETKMFEGSLFLSEPKPFLVAIMGVIVFILFVLHSALAMRKFPYKWREYKMLKTHSLHIGHMDTLLWIVQAITGFAMFFLGSMHLWIVISMPEKIGPFASSDRIYTDNMVWLYGALIGLVVFHAMIGLYRLTMKWGFGAMQNPRANRKRNRAIMWVAIVFFSLLAYGALAKYWQIGKSHKSNYGERYVKDLK